MKLPEHIKKRIQSETGEPVPDPNSAEWSDYFRRHDKFRRLADTHLTFPLDDPIAQAGKKEKRKTRKAGFVNVALKRMRNRDGKLVWGKGKALGLTALLLLLMMGYVAFDQIPKGRPVALAAVEEPAAEAVVASEEPPPDAAAEALSAFDALDDTPATQNQDATAATQNQNATPSESQSNVNQTEPDPFAALGGSGSQTAAQTAQTGEGGTESPPPNGLDRFLPKNPQAGTVSAGSGTRSNTLTSLGGQRTATLGGGGAGARRAANLAVFPASTPPRVAEDAAASSARMPSSLDETAADAAGREATPPLSWSTPARSETQTFAFDTTPGLAASRATQTAQDDATPTNNLADEPAAPFSFDETTETGDRETKQDPLYRPGDTLLGALELGVVMVDDDGRADAAESRVVVRGADGSIWLGSVTLQRSGRVSIEFDTVVTEGKSQPVQAIALGPDNYAGLQARFRETTPALASDLTRGALRGVSEYVEGLNSRAEVTFRGTTPIVSGESAPLGESVAGSVSRLFAPPQGDAQQAIVRIAEVDPGTELTIIVIA